MILQRRPGRGLSIMGALLLSSALAAPAFAEIEEVVVTAQKKSEDIQRVPIAVSAFSGQDLAAHQIEQFKDLQFQIPSVTFTNGNFGGANFQIRGIGSAAVAISGDAGVATNVNQFYLAAPPLTNATYYDVAQIQVLRGPQSTLWGRNATGGAIDIETAKPDLDNFGADLEGTFGNYDAQEVRAMANMPIIDGQLAARVALFWENRDGTVDNLFNKFYGKTPGVADSVDSRNDYSFRGSMRWEPTSNTTVDFMVQTAHEDDSRVRGQVQLCHRDPSGILGCLPDSLRAQALNGNATLGVVLDSNVTLGDPLALFDVTGPGACTNPADPATCGEGAGAKVPNSLRAVSTDFTPTNHNNDTLAIMHWNNRWTDWLSSDATLGVDRNSYESRESYFNSAGDAFSQYSPTCLQLFLVSSGADNTCTPIPGLDRLTAAQLIFGSIAPQNFSTFFGPNLGRLQESGVGNNGIIGGNVRSVSDRLETDDASIGASRNWSAEWRFQTNFTGPLNFLLAGYHLEQTADAKYLVMSNALDYFGIIYAGGNGQDGTVLGPTFYENNSKKYSLTSNAVFAEGYYDAIPDELKFTAGARYTSDDKGYVSRQTLLETTMNTYGACPVNLGPTCTAFMPIGTTDWNTFLNNNNFDADAHGTAALFFPDPNPGIQNFVAQRGTFDAWTGRALVNWTPKTDFTDQTTVYLSYSRGYRSGGFNPPSFTHSFAQTFQPETIDALELGTKNTLFGDLQANLTGWYYDYKGYQISEIVDRTSVNLNVNSKLYGVEGEFFWAATDQLQFNMNFGYTHSALDNTQLVDTRDPTAGMPNVTLVKDSTNGANCVITNDPGFPSAEAIGLVLAPPTPTPGVFASGYSPHNAPYCAMNDAVFQALVASGLPPSLQGHYHLFAGIPKNLTGNQMPLTPPWTVSIGAQYTMPLSNDYNLVARVDYYWKDTMWARIWEDGADKIKPWGIMNAQIQLNAPDNLWYGRFWVQNVFDDDNITGEYVTDPTSALFTNAFVTQPRTYGITLGMHI
ncbi:MAG TPA: TonB-dependent receptor [Rhizomicrobium sp.]|nr:TonB-dependent receptor [Rhizomicrobium sp.]